MTRIIPSAAAWAALSLLAGAPAGGLFAATHGEEELQRCVWRCLASDGPAENPAYHACVARSCGSGAAPPEPGGGDGAASGPSDPTRVWAVARAPDGAMYAGIDAAGRAGAAGLYLFCRGGQARLVLVGMSGSGTWRLSVDGSGYTLSAAPGSRGWPELALPYDAPVLRALGGGGGAELRDPSGRVAMRVSLRGSREAIGRVVAGC